MNLTRALAPVFISLTILSNTPAFAQTAPQTEDPRDRVLYAEETESFRPLVSKLARNIFMDEKEIFTSPFHIHKSDAKWWLLFGGSTAVLISVDRHLSNQLPNTSDQVAFSGGISRLGASYTVLPIAAGFYGYGALKDNPKARETGALGFEALMDAAITVEVLKYIFNRERPTEGSEKGHFFKWPNDSFPSGHSVMSFAFASVVSHEYSRYRIAPFLAYGLAATVSASRFSARKHWASDIVAGGSIGWFIGDYVFRTNVDHRIHKRGPAELKTWLRPKISPIVSPASRSYALTLNWVWQ